MANGIDSSVGGLNANSYISMANALDYASHSSFVSSWTALASAVQENALRTATEYLDVWVDWDGSIVDKHRTKQNLRWPRYSVIDIEGDELDSDIIPIWLQYATIEFAYFIANSGDPFGTPDTAGFRQLKVGELEMRVNIDDRDAYAGIPDRVQAIIEPYGTTRTKGGAPTASLVRT